MKRVWTLRCALCACLSWTLLGMARAGAQPTPQTLPQGSLREARQQAQQSIDQGGQSPEQLIALYEILARTTARIGDEEGASAAFVRLLALAPNYRLPPEEPEAVRSRFLEARGFWAAHAERIVVEPAWQEQTSSLVIKVVDPVQLASRVRVRWRPVGRLGYLETVRLPSAEVAVSAAPAADVEALELAVALLDEHGNRLLQYGSDSEPKRLRIRAHAPVASARVQTVATLPADHVQRDDERERKRRRLMIASGVSGGVALLVGGGALWAYLEREDAAQLWNAGRCTGTGTTRATLCADEHARVQRMERLSVGLLAASGGALIGSAVLLLLAPGRERVPSSTRSASVRCHAGPGDVGLGCTATY